MESPREKISCHPSRWTLQSYKTKMKRDNLRLSGQLQKMGSIDILPSATNIKEKMMQKIKFRKEKVGKQLKVNMKKLGLPSIK